MCGGAQRQGETGVEPPDPQSDDDQGQRHDEGRAVQEPVAGATPTSLPAGDGEGSPAGGIGCVRRRALRGGPALRAASMTGGCSTASRCRRRGAAGAGGAPRRLRGRGTHTTIVGAHARPTRREAPLRAQGHTRRRGAGRPHDRRPAGFSVPPAAPPGDGGCEGGQSGVDRARRWRGSRNVFEPETRISQVLCNCDHRGAALRTWMKSQKSLGSDGRSWRPAIPAAPTDRVVGELCAGRSRLIV